jgi:hypothetical protein
MIPFDQVITWQMDSISQLRIPRLFKRETSVEVWTTVLSKKKWNIKKIEKDMQRPV